MAFPPDRCWSAIPGASEQLCDSYGSARVVAVASWEYVKSLGKVRENPCEDPDGARPVHVFM